MNLQDNVACANVISGSNEVLSRLLLRDSSGFSGFFSSKASWWLLLLSTFSSFDLDESFSILFSSKIFCPTIEFSNEVKLAVTVLNGEKQNVFIQINIVEYEKNLEKFPNQIIALGRL